MCLLNRNLNGVIYFPTYHQPFCNPQNLQLIKYIIPSESQSKRWLMQKDRPSTWLLKGLRLKRICNSENAFGEKLRELKGFLVKRGYNFVDDQFGRVRKVDRNNLLMRKEGVKNRNRNCFVIDYHPALNALYNIFRELQVIL